RTAPFDAVYASWGTEQPRIATNEATLMIEPEPCSSILGIAYLQPRYTPRTLTAMTLSQVSTSVSMTEWSAAGMIPALLYRASTRPKVATAWSAIASLTSTHTTRAPSAANIRAAVRPMPPPAPVMIVTLSSRRTVAGSSLRSRPRLGETGQGGLAGRSPRRARHAVMVLALRGRRG